MRILMLSFVVLLFALPIQATPIFYTFNTISGATGSFTLDSSPFVFTGHGGFTIGYFHDPTPFDTYHSAATLISGTYGDYSFSESGACCGAIPSTAIGLDILDYQSPYDSALDQAKGDWWIERANVSGPALNGRSVISLLIFDYPGAAGLSGPGFIPPPPIHDAEHFHYNVGFSDGTHESGGLAS